MPNQKITARKKNSVIFPILGLAFFLTSMNYIIDFSQISDWRGYEYLLFNQGGWLASLGIDRLFQFILALSIYLPGQMPMLYLISICYISMTASIIFVFRSYFTWRPEFSNLLFFIVVANIFLSKFAAQIREGLAIAFFLTFLAICRSQLNTVRALLAASLLLASFSVHGALLPLLMISAASVIFSHLFVKVSFVGWGWAALTTLIAVILSFSIMENPYIIYDNVSYALGEIRYIDDNYIERTILSIVNLTVHILIAFHTRRALEYWSHSNLINGSIFKLLGFIFTPCILLTHTILTASGYADGTLLASLGRLGLTFQSIFMLGALIVGARNVILFPISLVILLNQIRVLMVSASS